MVSYSGISMKSKSDYMNYNNYSYDQGIFKIYSRIKKQASRKNGKIDEKFL